MSDRLSQLLNLESLFKKRNNKIIPFYTKDQMQKIVEFGKENSLKMKLVQMKDTRLAIRCKCGGNVKIQPYNRCGVFICECGIREAICYDCGFNNIIYGGEKLRTKLGVREKLYGIQLKQ